MPKVKLADWQPTWVFSMHDGEGNETLFTITYDEEKDCPDEVFKLSGGRLVIVE